MDNQNYIHNISVIAHVDHWKSTLTDSLIARARIIPKDNSEIQMDQAERGISIKSTSLVLYYEYDISDKRKEEILLINLIAPGNNNATDGVLVMKKVSMSKLKIY